MERALVNAVKKCDHQKVGALLKSGVDINGGDLEKQTPLHLAVVKGNYALCQTLLAAGANPNFRGKHSVTSPFDVACYYGHHEIAKIMLENGADIKIVDRFGNGALHIASRHGHVKVVSLLLEKIDVNGTSVKGITPLIEASYRGQLEVVRLLLKNGANADLVDHSHWTALHNATRERHLEIVETLLTHGANVNLATSIGNTPIFLAVRTRREEIVSALLTHGAATDLMNLEEQTPLSLAAQMGNKRILSRLLEGGASVNFSSPTRGTALYTACYYGHLDIAEFLLNNGADPNATKINIAKRDVKPLQVAMISEKLDVVELLLKSGADVNRVNESGCSPLHMAVEIGNPDLVRLLLEYKADYSRTFMDNTALDAARRFGRLPLVKILAQHELDNQISKSGVEKRDTVELSDEDANQDGHKIANKTNFIPAEFETKALTGTKKKTKLKLKKTKKKHQTAKVIKDVNTNTSRSEPVSQPDVDWSDSDRDESDGLAYVRKLQRSFNALIEKIESNQDPEEAKGLSEEVNKLLGLFCQEARALYREGINVIQSAKADIGNKTL